MIVNYDIDGLCAAKILQGLFRCDNIIYTLCPVQTVEDLQRCYEQHCNEIKYIIFVNCGGTIDLVELLDPQDEVVFFVVDSHRPTDVYNVYSTAHVRLLTEPDEDENIPDFEAIFSDDEESEGSNSESDDSESEAAINKRMRMDEEALLKRREKKIWQENRKSIMFDYSKHSYYSQPSALVMYDLAWKLNKDCVDMLWWAVVGIAEQYILNKMEYNKYLDLTTTTMYSHVSRICNRLHVNNDDDTHSLNSANTFDTSSGNTILKITSDDDLNLALFRHWTIESSIRYSRYTAVNLKLWTIKGEKRLNKMLAEMGMPLVESKQKFSTMDLSLRNEFMTMMNKVSVRDNLPHLVIPSFYLSYGYTSRYAASDYVYSLLALLSRPSREKSFTDCFLEAFDALARVKRDLLESGISRAKKLMIALFRQVQNAIEMKQIKATGPFYCLILNEGTADSQYFSHPHLLPVLAYYVLESYVAVSHARKAATMPLIVSLPHDVERSTCLITGVPPILEDSGKSFFGKAFEQAAEKCNVQLTSVYFDSSVIELKMEERTTFLEALTSLLI